MKKTFQIFTWLSGRSGTAGGSMPSGPRLCRRNYNQLSLRHFSGTVNRKSPV